MLAEVIAGICLRRVILGAGSMQNHPHTVLLGDKAVYDFNVPVGNSHMGLLP